MAEKVYVFPLSFAQQRLWLLDQMEPGNSAYNIPAALRLRGHLDVVALEKAIDEIVRRHEVLRTVFADLQGQPVQVIKQSLSLSLPVVDLAKKEESKRDAEVSILATQEAKRQFDLSKGPLLQPTLIRLSQQDHILLLIVHHIVFDGWSLDLFVREMAALYEAFAEGKQSPLPDLPIQYADYASWQRQWLQGEDLQAQLSFWKRQLQGSVSLLKLPLDRPRPAVQTFQGANQSLSIPRSLTGQLKALAHQEGATLFMVLLAAFYVLLLRYTAQEDITIGSPVANRDEEELEGLIGCFVNTIVMRADLSGNPTFREFLQRVREMTVEAHAHGDLPFEKLVEELQPERDLSHTPLFQVMLSLQNIAMPELSFYGLTISQSEVDNGTAELDWLLVLRESEQELDGFLQYNTDLFGAAMMERVAGHFQTLLHGIVGNPQQRLNSIPMLTQAEQHEIVLEWNNTGGDYSKHSCIHDLFEAQVERTPDAIAVESEDERLTYRELNARANQLAHYLQKRSVGPEVLVGICMERSTEFIVALMGVLKAGAAYVPLDSTYPVDRLAFMIEDAHAPILLTQQRLIARLSEDRAGIICLDTDWHAISSESRQNPTSEVSPDNLAYVIYTSGSTGKPKGTMIQHRSLVSYTQTAIDGYGVESSDRVLQFCSISFDISAEEIFPCLTRGGALVLRTDWMLHSIATFLQTCRDWNLTMLSLPTAYWHEITASLGTVVAALPPSFRLIIIAGERALPDRLTKWQKYVGGRVRLINTYGLTESTIISTLGELTGMPLADTELREVPVGPAIRNTQIYILNAGQQPAPIGIPDELYIGGLLLARGYFNRPDVTAERFIPNPFNQEPGSRLYKTGDLARFLSDGNIEFLGRNDNQVKIRGFRVELREIESMLRRHPLLRDAVVLAREADAGEKQLVAYVVAEIGEAPNVSELRRFLKKELPDYMVPSAFVMLESLPLTPNGKVNCSALPVVDGLRPAQALEYVAPRTEIERAVTRIWQEVLQVEGVGIHDNFFDLGGHSLRIIELRNKLRENLGVEIPMVELFKYPTINSFTHYWSSGQDQQQPADQRAEGVSGRKESRKRRKESRQNAQARGR